MCKSKIVQRTPVQSAPRFTYCQYFVPFASFIPPPPPSSFLSQTPPPCPCHPLPPVGILFERFESKLSILWPFTPTYFSMCFLRIKVLFYITQYIQQCQYMFTLVQCFYIIYGNQCCNQCWADISHLISDSLRASVVLHFVVNKVKLLIPLGRKCFKHH